MRIKSYFAKTITEAMERARVELGPDAMIIASNRTSGETERLGLYEVVFGIAEAQKPAPELVTPMPAPLAVPQPAPQPRPQPAAQPREGLERMRDRMEDMRKSVSKKRAEVSQARMPFAARVSAMLVQSGFPQRVADELSHGLQGRDKHDLVNIARTTLNSRLRVAPTLGVSGRSGSIAALVGPPGAGKTTTLVKLAIKYGIATGRPTRLVSTDAYRLGGSDLLRRYAEAMDIRFDTTASVAALDRTLASVEGNSLVLIDTEGVSGATAGRNSDLASYLAGRADIDVHLALPAYTPFADLSNLAGRFKPFLPSKLILTNLDACSNVGPVLAHALANESAISFLGTGCEVTEDLDAASAGALTARLLPSLTAAAATLAA